MNIFKAIITLLILFSSVAHAGENVLHEELEVQWAPAEKSMMLDGESSNFINATNKICNISVNSTSVDERNGLSGQVGAVVVDWIASRLITAFRDRELRKIAQYSASCSNSPIYDKKFAFLEGGDENICVIARRITCTVEDSLAKKELPVVSRQKIE